MGTSGDGRRSVTLDDVVADLIARGEDVTVEALGGMDQLTTEVTTSPLFPYVARAIIADWAQLREPERSAATDLVTEAIGEGLGGLALGDTCVAVVPVAPALSISMDVKVALRTRIADRSDVASGSVAAIALRWLAHLAVITDEARPALVDVLTAVARGPESMPFAVAAAQVAGLAYDHWRDDNARQCILRLVESDGDADAWFALGQSRLIDALEAADREACMAGLRTTLECFDNAANTGEQRPDAVMYGHAVRFVTAWASDATVDMLAADYEGARAALQEYLLHGLGLAEQPMWVRPRYETETAWIELVRTMRAAVEAGPAGSSWYEPAVAIGALADVYRVANSLRPRRATDEATAPAFPELVAPTVIAPFIEDARRIAFVDRWLQESDDPHAEEFAQLVRQRTGRVVPPKRRPPGHSRR